MRNSVTAYIGLGSNLGDREAHIRSALELLSRSEAVEVSGVSRLVETRPLAQAKQPSYINAVARIQTTLPAGDVLGLLNSVEKKLGRVRKEKWASRVIDLDLLLFGEEVIQQPALTVPHPQMHLRSFVLRGLCELDAKLIHPLMNVTVEELAARLNGRDFVLEPGQAQLISVAGVIGVGKTTVARKLAELLDCRVILEEYDKNPFLPQVYEGRKELALDSQLFFLTSRVAQLSKEALGPAQLAVTDYLFEKELIYAEALLDGRQLQLYRNVYRYLENRVVRPVVVIYLQDTVENCLERVRRRNRPYEQRVKADFLEQLHRRYDKMLADWQACPVIRLRMSRFDCMKPDDMAHLAKQVRSYVAV